MVSFIDDAPAIAAGTEESRIGAGLLIGVYALQGDFMEHEAMLRRLGANTRQIRKPEDLEGIQAIVIPGGESTVIDKLSRIFGLAEPLQKMLTAGLPALLTCAGLIYAATDLVDAAPGQRTLGVLNARVQRNAFGSQLDSFVTQITVRGIGEHIPATFIRGPIVQAVGAGAQAVASLADGRIVAVQQGDILGLAFHPEQDSDHRIVAWWLRRVRARDFR
ncbi:MAG: pyridoxal 5'-phosphate synthase glutaminase subunit PdxT [Arcanobacterium sp.]|nr:pyridoxal 5'-phosphate synthase glutaminase subunit PdxT [Arcanobacterium sp.]MDY5588521.1 pyridoxal 5'-phosphate synthase glutaminase subunit PdxT [Arcanobacterium sp.]